MAEFRRSGSFTLSPRKQSNLLSGVISVTSSAKRKSISAQIITPRSHVLIEGSENNDEAERRERQLNRLQQFSSRTTASPTGTPTDRRKSLSTVAGLTNQQLTDHYAKCIQLSAENKINIKNAFDLQLIDYMTEMLKRKDPDMNNFQVASCTLDASTKIYAYRVDSIHTDTIKIAGGLGRTKEKHDVEGPGGEEGIQEKVKKKYKGKKHSTIETNLKNINVPHFDIEFDVDPLFKKTAAQFDEGRAGGGQFLSSLHMLSDSCELILDSETVLMGLCQNATISQSVKVSIPPFPDLNKCITPTFATFEFSNWDVTDEDGFSEMSKLHKDNDTDKDEHAFDINAIPEPLEDNNDNVEPDSFNDYGCEDDTMTTDATVFTIGRDVHAQGPKPPPPKLEVTHLKDHLANAPLEYSYFDTRVMSAWAGPDHWKLKPLIKDKLPGTKTTDRKSKNFTLEYSPRDELEKFFSVLKIATKLTKHTIKKWSYGQTTMPVDLHYKPKKFYSVYLRPEIFIRRQTTEESAEVDDNIDGYNYDNKNDQENYCANVETGSNYGGSCGAADEETFLFSETILPTQDVGYDKTKDFFGDNLVEAPFQVAKLNIGYARTAKKMDMKKLKSIIWEMYSSRGTDKENKSDDKITKEGMDCGSTLEFSRLYSDLPHRMPLRMAENLSVPLAFIALLHLANENCLSLKSAEELGDFAIAQG